MNEANLQKTVAFVVSVCVYHSDPGPKPLRIFNAPRHVFAELERWNVRVEPVDEHWVEGQRKRGESKLVCAPG